ncbi:MAG: hypothetical protein ABFD50_17610 [Smithella sp.]
MANLLDDPEVQKYLFGSDPMDNTGRNQTTQLEDWQNQQVANGNVPPVVAPPLVSPQDVVQAPTGTTELQPNADTPNQYAFQQPEPQKITSILDLIRENKPVQDPNLDQRYKKAAMLDSLGQAFGNLAGAVGVGMGASVPKLPIDNNIARLYGMKEAEKQRYLQQKREWDREMLQGKISEMGSEANARKEANAETWNQRKYALDVKKANDALAIAMAKEKTAEGRQAVLDKHNAVMEKIAQQNANANMIRANKPSASETANDPNKTVYTWRNPNTQKLEEYNSADFGNLFDTAKLNKSTDDIKTIMSNYQNNTKAGQQEIVTRMLNEKAKADKELADRATYMVESGDMDKKPQAYPSPTGKPLTAEQLGQNTPTSPVPGTITGPEVGSHVPKLSPFEQFEFDKTPEGQRIIEEKRKANIKAYASGGRPELDTTIRAESTSHTRNIQLPQTTGKKDWSKYKRN